MNRRKFLSTAATVGALTIVPRSVLGKGFVAPSDRISIVHIGCGTEGLNEVNELLKSPQIEIVGVADPNKESYNYIHWSENGLRDELRQLIGEPQWKEGIKGIPGGRDVMKEVVEIYYKKNRPNRKGKGVECYEDYRELLDRMKDVDAVKIMTPDHLHGYVAADCIRRGKHAIMHKPLGNKMLEAMKVVDLAKQSRLSTHMMAYNAFGDGNMAQIKAWLDAGAIGELKEIHNWTNRPVWPQYPDIPAETPPIPAGFNWDLWL
jgi:predicted dehydrogenase